MTTPGSVLSFVAGLYDTESVPSFTDETVLLPRPPKKPVPLTLIVTGARLEPVDTLKLLTVGTGVVTVNWSAK